MRKMKLIFMLLTSIFLISCQHKDSTFSIEFDVNGADTTIEKIIDIANGSEITLPTLTMDHYVFVGWYEETVGDKIYLNGNITVSKNMKLIAEWRPLSYRVTFYDDLDDILEVVSVGYQEEAIATLIPSKEGHTFIDWDKDITSITSDLDVYPVFQKNTYKVTLYDIDGEVISSTDVLFGDDLTSLNHPTLEHHQFDGWYMDQGFSEAFDLSTMPAHELDLYSKWTHLSLIGPVIVGFQNPTYVNNGQKFNPLFGVTATDITDGDLTEDIIITGWSNSYVNHSGEYIVILSVEDSDGNTTNVSFKVIVSAIAYDASATYKAYIGAIAHMNPHNESSKSHLELFNLIGDSLYRGDYDWDKAIELGIATHVGDFTHTANLPFGYVPSMALSHPHDVFGNGLVWDISLRSDLSFIDGYVIDAHTFDYAWKELLSPLLRNQNAHYLFDQDYLPLVNAFDYYNQFQPDLDNLGFPVYMVNGVRFSRENALYLINEEGHDLYHVENMYENLIGPGGVKAYVSKWGGEFFGKDGWVLQTPDDAYFHIATDDNLYAPTSGWTLNGVPVPHILPEGVYLRVDGSRYAGAYPAYMDQLGNRTQVTEVGIPIDGQKTITKPAVDWEDVGFEVINDTTIRIHLITKKTSWQVMENLSTAITSVVHPHYYDVGFHLEGDINDYGTQGNPYVSFGRYKMTEWDPQSHLMLTLNLDHYDHEAYRIEHIKYLFISNHSILFNEFTQGHLDVSPVPGSSLLAYKDSPYLKFIPTTAFFRFAFSLDRMNDGDPSNDNPMMKYLDLRKALYFATDRTYYTDYIRYPGYPTHGLLGPAYVSGALNPFSYRGSTFGQAVLADYAPDTFGYDPVRAKHHFDLAYEKAVADGVINDGDIVSVELLYFDSGTSHNPLVAIESQWESILGPKFNLVLISDTQAAYMYPGVSVLESRLFDIIFGGWQGLQYDAPAMLQVYSNVNGWAYMIETGFETGHAMLDVDLADGKLAVQGWLSDLLTQQHRTEDEEAYIELFQNFIADFNGDIYTNTYDYLWEDVYYRILSYDTYEGREDDFDKITAALEGELLSQMINIPLFTSVSTLIYSERIGFDAQAYHARMGWGGYRYMYIIKE